MSGPGRAVFWPFQVLGALVVVGVAVCARVMGSGSEDLSTARAAREAGLPATAVDYYGRAARWYLPIVGPHAPARREMAALCQEVEASGDQALALRCHREMRGAILATRWLVTPDSDLLEASNRAIARLVAQEKGPDGSPVLPEALHLEILHRDEAPNPWLSALAVLLFCGWIGMAGFGLWTSITPEGTVSWRRLGGYILVSLALAAAWLVALRLA